MVVSSLWSMAYGLWLMVYGLWKPIAICQQPTANSQQPTAICLAFLFIVNCAYGAPDVPLNFDGWITEALAKLETNGITGGFHRQTAPLSRAEIIEIIAQAESRIQAGEVVISAIDRNFLKN